MLHFRSTRFFLSFEALLSIALLSGPLASAQKAGGVPPLNRTNVLLIVIDDLGIETLDFYDYNPDDHFCLSGSPPSSSITPKLAALAQQGVVFRRAYGYPVCNSSRAAILTGRHGLRTGMGEVNPNYDLPISEVTIADMLKGGFPATWPKYKCGAFGKWGVNHADAPEDYTNPIDQGFDRFVGYVRQLSDHFSWEKVDDYASPPGSLPIVSTDTRFSASAVRQDALEWIQSIPEPFFAYVCFSTPHGPYQVPPPGTVSQNTQDEIDMVPYQPGEEPADPTLAYRWLIEATDTEIDALVNGLGSKQENTTILIVADNGTPGGLLVAPYEGGPWTSGGHGKGSVYEQGARVPFLAIGNKVPGVGIHDGVVSVVDLWRTIANITGATPGVGGNDSVSLYGVLQDPQATLSRTSVFYQVFPNGLYDQQNPPGSNQRAIVSREFKYIRRTLGASLFLEEAYQLTDGSIDVDPTECVDLFMSPLPMPVEDLRTEMIQLYGEW